MGSEDEEFRERTEDHEGPFSIFRLIGIFPVLIMYSAIFGSIAFYTYLVEKRFMMNRNKNYLNRINKGGCLIGRNNLFS